MTNADLTEMEWLAAVLRTTAERLERATALLRAAGDLERLQAKLAVIAAERPRTRSADRPASLPASVGRAPAAGERRELDSPASPVLASRAGAVFDEEEFAPGKLAKKSAGAGRSPF